MATSIRTVATFGNRPGKVVVAYDDGDRLTSESWFADVNDATADREIEFTYDLLGRLFTSSDADHENIYVYERRDLDVATTVLGGALTGLESAFWFYNEYDAVGNRTYAQVSLDVVDFVNTYAYDNLHRLTSVVQSDEGYTAVVTDKRVDFTYDLAGQLDTVKRYASTSTASPVAVTDYDYDLSGRVSQIDHRAGATPGSGTQLAGYGYAWNERNQLTAIDFLPSAYNGEDVTYDYDNRHQLESATYNGQSNETYAYDDNGNRNNGGFTVGANNRLLDDGTYDYQYDDEGNRTKRIHQTTYDSTVYVWDHRNRLVEVRDYDGNGTSSTGDDTLIQEVDYAYDADNQIVKRVVDVAGATPIEQTFYLWENGQILLQLDKTGPGDLTYQDLSHRYLWGPLVDQLLADEQVDWTDSDPDGEVLWALTDHLGTVRDIVNNSATVVDHAEYSAFGKRLDPAAVDVVFGFTGKLFDEATGLQNNWHRWYDAAVGEWASEDFIWDGTNPHAYVGNKPTMWVDPSGLEGVGHHYFPQKYLKLFLADGLIDLDAFLLGMGYASGELTEHLNDEAHRIWSNHAAVLFKEKFGECGQVVGKVEMKSFIDSIATGKNPLTGKIDPVLNKYIETRVRSRIVTAFDNSNLDDIIKRGLKYDEARKFLREFAPSASRGMQAAIERLLGSNARKRLGKAIPVIGTFFAAWYFAEDVEARGCVGGTVNSTLDAIPILGTAKAIAEIPTGWTVIDTLDEAELRRTRWEFQKAWLDAHPRKPPTVYPPHYPQPVPDFP